MRMTSSEYGKIWRDRHPLYSVHIGMLQRCGQKRGCRSESNLRRYRDRGITVCDEWRHFRNFELWAMSHGWRKGLQIDRVDTSKGYSPDNCRFVTPSQNSRTKLVGNRIVEYRGKRMCLIECLERYAPTLKFNTAWTRLARGWTLERTIETPVICKRKKK